MDNSLELLKKSNTLEMKVKQVCWSISDIQKSSLDDVLDFFQYFLPIFCIIFFFYNNSVFI